MAVFELPVRSDLPAYTFKQELEGSVYTFGFRFNERFGVWIMDISDEVGSPIILGTPVYTDVNILGRFPYESLPPGFFVCIDQTGEQRNPSRDDFGNEIKLLYLESSELA